MPQCIKMHVAYPISSEGLLDISWARVLIYKGYFEKPLPKEVFILKTRVVLERVCVLERRTA